MPSVKTLSAASPFVDQIGLDRFSAAQREFFVISVGTEAVCVADDYDGVKLDSAQFVYEVVQSLFSFWFQVGLIEIE